MTSPDPPLGRVIAVCDLKRRGTAELGGNREISSTLPGLSRVALEQYLRKGRPATRVVMPSNRDQREINFISGGWCRICRDEKWGRTETLPRPWLLAGRFAARGRLDLTLQAKRESSPSTGESFFI